MKEKLEICFHCGKPITPSVGKYRLKIVKENFWGSTTGTWPRGGPASWRHVNEIFFHMTCFLSVMGEKYCPPGRPPYTDEDRKAIKLKKNFKKKMGISMLSAIVLGMGLIR